MLYFATKTKFLSLFCIFCHNYLQISKTFRNFASETDFSKNAIMTSHEKVQYWLDIADYGAEI